MEYGSFLELDLRDTGEYFDGIKDIARLNSGRSGILHALRVLDCSGVYLPFYICPSVKGFLESHGIKINYYSIDSGFKPLLAEVDNKTAVVIVNYFGILSERWLKETAACYTNVIIDNCAGFFSKVLPDNINVYSCRKFFGVPDGAYVIGPNADSGIGTYSRDLSSATAQFLLKRHELGCSKVYKERMLNEERIDKSGLLRMSTLTQKLLKAIDYDQVKSRRKQNFKYAHSLFAGYNLLGPALLMDEDCIPMVYPLLVKDKDLVEEFKKRNIYTGRWWVSVIQQVEPGSFEASLSNYMVPLPIDQRYGEEEINYYYKVFKEIIKAI